MSITLTFKPPLKQNSFYYCKAESAIIISRIAEMQPWESEIMLKGEKYIWFMHF